MEKNNTTKICPLKPPASYNHETGETIYFKCEEAECGWWCGTVEKCAMVSIAKSLRTRK